jgi:serine/threonine protein kinase
MPFAQNDMRRINVSWMHTWMHSGGAGLAQQSTHSAFPLPWKHGIGNYELLERIGGGGGGEVYAARHTKLDRRDAVKLLSARDAGDVDVRQRFFQEMKSIGRLKHPHIVQAYDAGEAHGVLYLAMELVDGPDVAKLAQLVSPMAIADACEIVRQAALGLQHIFEHGLVHRDLKPSNLLLSSTGIKVADLGMALLRESEPDDARLTGSFVVMGTADYMAPEQTEGARHLDIRADLYSLGCTLYGLLAGHAPFASIGTGLVLQKLHAHAHTPVPSLCIRRPETPTELLAVLERLLAKEKSERYSEPQELVAALAPFCVGADLPRLLEMVSTERGVDRADRKTIAYHTLREHQPSSSPTDLPTTFEIATRQLRRRAYPILGLCALVLLASSRMTCRDGAAVPVVDNNLVPEVTIPFVQGQSDTEAPAGESTTSSATVGPSIEAKAASLGAIAQDWKKTFGVVPIEVHRPGGVGRGAWHLDDELGALTINTDKTIRLVKLGATDDASEDDKVTIGVDCYCRSANGRFGIFWGLRPVADARARQVKFMAIEVFALNDSQSKRRSVIRQYLATINPVTGAVRSEGYRDTGTIDARADRENWRLEVAFRGASPILVSFCGQQFPELCGDRTDLPTPGAHASGDFGVYALDGSVWYGNPMFEQNSLARFPSIRKSAQ